MVAVAVAGAAAKPVVGGAIGWTVWFGGQVVAQAVDDGPASVITATLNEGIPATFGVAFLYLVGSGRVRFHDENLLNTVRDLKGGQDRHGENIRDLVVEVARLADEIRRGHQ